MADTYFIICDPGSPLDGRVGRLVLRYYDHLHTGESPDMLYLDIDGTTVRVLSTCAEQKGECGDG